MDAFLDAISNPVPDAKAGPAPVDTVACGNVTVQGPPIGSNPTTYYYAEKAFPGMTAADLSAVRVSVNYPAGSPSLAYSPPGYTAFAVLGQLKDGFVAVQCGNTINNVTSKADSVTFVGP